MKNAKWPIDTDDGLYTQSHAAQTFRGQANHLMDPFSPSPSSKSYFVDIHAQEVTRSPSVNTLHPLDTTVRSHRSTISPISPKRPRSASPLSFFAPSCTHPSTLFNPAEPPLPEISFLDLPESRPENKRRSSWFGLVTPPSPTTDATPRKPKPSRFRLKSLRRVPRRCRTATWFNSLFSPNKPTRPKHEDRGSTCDTSNSKVLPNIPNLNDITDMMASSFSNLDAQIDQSN